MMRQSAFILILLLSGINLFSQNENIINVKLQNYPKKLEKSKSNSFFIEIDKSDFRGYARFFIIYPQFFEIGAVSINNENLKKRQYFMTMEWYSMPVNEQINFSVLATPKNIASQRIKIYYGLEYQTYNQRALQMKALIYEKKDTNKYIFLKDTLIYPAQKNIKKTNTTNKENSDINNIFDFFNQN